MKKSFSGSKAVSIFLITALLLLSQMAGSSAFAKTGDEGKTETGECGDNIEVVQTLSGGKVVYSYGSDDDLAEECRGVFLEGKKIAEQYDSFFKILALRNGTILSFQNSMGIFSYSTSTQKTIQLLEQELPEIGAQGKFSADFKTADGVKGFNTASGQCDLITLVNSGPVGLGKTGNLVGNSEEELLTGFIVVCENGKFMQVSIEVLVGPLGEAIGINSPAIKASYNAEQSILTLRGPKEIAIDLAKMEVLKAGPTDLTGFKPLKVPFSFEDPSEEQKTEGPVLVDEEGQPIENLDEYIRSKFTIYEPAKLSDDEIEKMKNDPEIRELRIALQQGAAAILGDSGTGKTELVKRYFAALKQGAFPESKKFTKLVIADVSQFQSGTKYVGTAEARARALIEYGKDPGTLIFIDEFHSMVGAGTHSQNPSGTVEMFKTPLGEKKLKLIVTDTPFEFYSAYGGNQALLRRFTVVSKNEPTTKETLAILEVVMARRGKSIKNPEILEKILDYSNSMAAVGAQPARSIEFLDRVEAEMATDALSIETATIADVNRIAQAYYKFDPAIIDPVKRAAKLEALPTKLDEYLVGMDLFKEKAIKLSRQHFAGLSDATKPPIRIGLFGPRGTGKTEAAITYAKAMNLPFKRIEMNQYAQGDPALFLKELGATIRANPYHVVLFDEFEKASIAVQNALLALLDSGFFNVQESGNVGREEKATVKVDARKAVFMLASNAGDDFIRQAFLEASGSQAALSAKTAEENNAAIQKALKSSLTPSMLEQHLMSQGLSGPILDRLQAVLPVFPATAFEFRNVVNLHASRIIDEANKELKDSKISLQFLNQADFVNLVASKFYYPGITNRAALRILQDTLRDQITEAKLAHANEAWNGEFSADLVKVAKQIEEQACDLSLIPKGSKIGFQYGNQK